MKLKHLGLAVAGLLGISITAALAGLWPGFPIVGIGTVCWGSATTTAAVTACPNTSPAGPTVVSGSELIPADIYNTTTGRPGNPATVLLSLASLNSLPITVQTVTIGAVGATAVSAGNTSGGIIYSSTITITSANITLPALPIDGQQYRVSSNRLITTLSVQAGAGASMSNAALTPTTLSPLQNGAYGYLFRYNASDTSWYRLQ